MPRGKHTTPRGIPTPEGGPRRKRITVHLNDGEHTAILTRWPVDTSARAREVLVGAVDLPDAQRPRRPNTAIRRWPVGAYVEGDLGEVLRVHRAGIDDCGQIAFMDASGAVACRTPKPGRFPRLRKGDPRIAAFEATEPKEPKP